jgi:hypothetical protein
MGIPILFAFTENDHWEPGIGDPTVVGWVTVVAYAVAAGLCFRAARATPKIAGQASGSRRFWSLFSVVLILLGINKQLDLQTWFTLFFKHLALDEGWYNGRRKVQAAFIAAVGLVGVISLTGMKLLAGKTTRPVLLGLMGGILLGCFILIRASSFHHVDQMLGMNLGGLKMNWILELGSISLVGMAACLALRSPPSRAPADGQNFIWVTAGDRLKDH